MLTANEIHTFSLVMHHACSTVSFRKIIIMIGLSITHSQWAASEINATTHSPKVFVLAVVSYGVRLT